MLASVAGSAAWAESLVGAAGGGIGACAGAIGVGAVGGVLMTKGNDIKLAAGTVLRIKFERPGQSACARSWA
jgi:hypothetical protein